MISSFLFLFLFAADLQSPKVSSKVGEGEEGGVMSSRTDFPFLSVLEG
jgi:hypothetical protein